MAGRGHRWIPVLGAAIGLVLGAIADIPIGSWEAECMPNVECAGSGTDFLGGFTLTGDYSPWQLMIAPAIGLLLGLLVGFVVMAIVRRRDATRPS